VIPVLLLLAAAPAPPPIVQTYAPAARETHLEQAVTAVKRTPPEVLAQAYQYVAVYERGACASANERLRVECMMTAAKRFCAKRPAAEGADCELYLDVVVSNLLAEKRLVPTERRYEIMRRVRDWRREVGRELKRIQGDLAVDFHLRRADTTEPPQLAKDIDTYCLETGDETGLSWQVCASSLIWFVVARAPSSEKNP
jgi:hypothetical protein